MSTDEEISAHQFPAYERTQEERKATRRFLEEHFASREEEEETLSDEEKETIRQVLGYVEERFGGMKYILGLALDFVFLAQRVSEGERGNRFEPDLSEEDLFERYERVKRSDGRELNTLTIRRENNGETVGIRQTEEDVLEFFHDLGRTDYPSAYVYNTGQWHKNKRLLTLAFRLSEAGRRRAAGALINYGLVRMTPNAASTGNPRPRLFLAVIDDYPRAAVEGENSGLVFQGIAYGYFKADRSHLSLIVDKVRTGSSRQQRIGDVDGYHGLDVEFSAEVKDLRLTADSFDRELSTFAELARRDGILGIAFCREFTAAAQEQVVGAGLLPFSQEELLNNVAHWDWPKQNRAFLALLHYLAHVEQNPGAVQRLLEFLAERDSAHDALRHFDPDEVAKSEKEVDTGGNGA